MQNLKYKIQNFLFLVIFLASLFFPLISLAQGLVPCGGLGDPCQLCDLFVLLDNVIDFVLKFIVMPIATLFIIMGGMMFFLYVESPQKIEQAKSLLTATIIGLVIIFSSWFIVSLFLTAIGLSDFALSFSGPDKWFIINCP